MSDRIVVVDHSTDAVVSSRGVQGIQGHIGPKGDSFCFKDSVPTVDDLPASAPASDGYLVDEDGYLYFYRDSAWSRAGYVRGPKGDQGEQGIQGLQGQQGEQGIQGIQGEQGVKGDKGDAGTSINVIDSVPTYADLPSDASVGDGYLVEADGDLYFMGQSGWNSAGHIVGPQGEQGIQGVQGEQGPQGIQGEQGIQGIQGERGPQGDQGLQGPKGDQGVRGDTGGYTYQTTTYAVAATDRVVECNGLFTVTLPTAVGISGQSFVVKNMGHGVITVATTALQTIDDKTTATLLRYDAMTVVSNGTNWSII